MQAAASAKFISTPSRIPSGAGQGASPASDAAPADGLDFAALMAAQIQGMDSAAMPVPSADAAAAGPLAAGEVAATELRAEDVPDAQAAAAVDPAMQAMAVLPVLVPAVAAAQQAAPGLNEAPPTPASGRSSGDQVISALATPVDAGSVSGRDKTAVSATDGAAEFAVDGKSLPSGDAKDGEVKGTEGAKFSVPAADAQRPPDAVPVAINANSLRDVGDMKVSAGSVQPAVGSSGWGEAVGQKVVWMAGQNQQTAELHLNPPHLGPMEVRLTINNDQVSALFVSHQPAVREAIEAAMPRLREMFADSGMMLGNAMVSSDSLPQQQSSGQGGRSATSQSSPDVTLAEGYSSTVTLRGVMSLNGDGRGLVDLFA